MGWIILYYYGVVSILDPKIGKNFKVDGQRLKPYVDTARPYLPTSMHLEDHDPSPQAPLTHSSIL